MQVCIIFLVYTIIKIIIEKLSSFDNINRAHCLIHLSKDTFRLKNAFWGVNFSDARLSVQRL